MSDIPNTYPVFESNQVLTSAQLNKLVGYLDQQNRLTRSRLIGMGVVCGLETDYDAARDELTISKGTGITSDGFLISLSDCTTVKYRLYKLPPGTIYEPFVNSSNVQDITLYELLTKEAEDGTEVKKLDDESFLNDKVVLLFVESFDKDLKSCLGKSCDELGKERILTVRKLLIGKSDLQTVWNRTNTGKPDAMFPEKYDLPVINMPRPLFDPEKTTTSDYKDFSLLYANTVLGVFDDLFKALDQTYDIYRPLLLDSYDEDNPFLTNPVVKKIGDIRNFLDNADPSFTSYLGVQYVHDLFLDLILAYNEFKSAAFDLMSECTPDRTRFPRHLMLGEALGKDLTLCERSEYRHHFVQPPVYNLQKQLVQQTIALHNRMVLMLESFDLKRINGISIPEAETGAMVRMTPSFEKRTSLSERAIPWYYDVNLESSYEKLGRLKDHWNFGVSRTCPKEKDGLVLSWDDQADDQSTAKDKLTTPLFYDIQDYSFFRIEGYISGSVDKVVKKINELKKQFNLPFDVVSLQLDTETSSATPDYRCGFEDIQEEYKMTRAVLCGIVHDLRETYLFVEKNREIIFNDENNGNAEKWLEKIKELMDKLKGLCEILTGCVEDFDFIRFRGTYKEILESIIDFFFVDMEMMDKTNIGNEDEQQKIALINGGFQRIFPLLFRLADLMFYNKFFRLYYSFKRRAFYLQKETSVFSTFLKKHPGIDHQSGVRKGGTFILLYENEESDEVFADFSLPYLCCTTENCVPACDDGSFVLDIPPFARPDYAVTTIDNPVIIDVMRNDYQMTGGDFRIKTEEVSEFGGEIKQASETGPLKYTPKKGFKGFDTFHYRLIDKKSGNSDMAKVTILVKEAGGEAGGCYSVDILKCWGEKDVIATLSGRSIEIGPDDNIYELLLNSLRNTGGFTEEEIKSGVLEGTGQRRQLVICLGFTVNDNTTYDELAQMIRQYQKDNCTRTRRPDNPLVHIDKRVLTESEIVKVLRTRGIIMSASMPRGQLEKAFETSEGSFTLSEKEVGLLTKKSIGRLMKERNITFGINDNKKMMIEKLFGG